ncbi:discoidin domain-containing protein [Streptomyces sp. NPDC056169]|uniref:discoidin domain-containing protein n=1 Tax=Streptomyces sp. NPDC056169 TaxID=3345734 RepID=UPI0035DFB6AC
MNDVADGDPDTSWASRDSGVNSGLFVDPGAPQTVKTITLSTAWGIGEGPTRVRVEAYLDGEWTQVLGSTALSCSSNTSTVESRTLTLPTAATGTTFSVVVAQANLTWGHHAINEWWPR